jgi:hypothetical protein
MALKWEELQSEPVASGHMYPERISRARVPGGWLVYTWELANNSPALTFVPDPDHRWDGSSLE